MVYRFLTEEGSCAQDRHFEVNRGLVKVEAMGFGGIMMAADVINKSNPEVPENVDDAMQSFVGRTSGSTTTAGRPG